MGTGGVVRTLNIGAGSLLDFNTNAISTAAGTGYIKNGAGVLATSGGTYTGGFTLNAGTVIMRGIDAMGGGVGHVLTLNGGTVASNASRTIPSTKYGGGIVIGGNVQFGELSTVVSLANSTANLSFANNVNLGNSTRTFTQGNNGTNTFSGIISNGGLTLARNADAASGQFSLSGANTFRDGLTLNSVTVNASGNRAALGDGNVTLTGDSATRLNLTQGLTFENTFTIADSAGTKTITNSGSNATIGNGITNNDSTGGLTIGAGNGRTFTIAYINGSGSKAVTFGGAGLSGTVVITGASNYTGNTVIDGSLVRLYSAGTSVSAANLVFKQSSGSTVPTFDLNGQTQTVAGLDDSAVAGIIRSTSDGGKLIVGDSNNSTFRGTITSVLGLEKVGSGKLTLTGANTYTNGTTITAGELEVSSQSLKGDVFNRSTLTFNQAFGNGTFAGYIYGSGSLTKKGANALTLTEPNNYTGGTTVSAGNLIGTTDSLQGAIVNNATVTFSQTVDGTYAGDMTGSGALVKESAGSVTLDGANTYSGGTTISGGALIGSTTSLQGNIATAAGTTLAFNQGTNGTYSGILSGAGALVKDGVGAVTLTGANTYTGGTTLTAGTLALGSADAIGTSGTIYFGGGTLQASASNTTDYSARFSNAASQQYKIDTNGQNLTLATALTSSGGSFTKLGSGTLALSGSNTYTGGTTISGGTLTAGHVNAFGTGALTIGAGTFLDLANYNIANRVTNNGGTILNAGTIAGGDFSGGTTSLSGANSTVAAVTGTATVNISGTDTAITTVSGGTVNVNAAGTDTAITTVSGGTVNVNAAGTTIQSYNGGDVAVGAGLAVTINEGTSSGTISGAGGLTKAGSGTMALSGSNSFSGALTVSAGIVNVQNATGLGTTAGSTTVRNGATLQLQGGITVGAEGLSLNGGAASGQTGALVNVSGTNTYGGAVTVTASSSISAASGSVLNLTGGVVKNGTVATFNGGGTINVNTVSISGSSANSDLVIDGTTVNVDVASTYNGPTFIRNSGTLNANVTDALPTANGRTAVTFDGTGTSVLSLGAAQSVASLTSVGAATVTLGGNTLTVGTSTSTDSTTFAGVISGSGGLIKDGASTQTLTGANTYMGTTTISGGTLEVGGTTGALSAASAVNINGGTLLLKGSAANRISDTEAISLGAAGSKLQLSGAVTETLGALTLAGGAGARVIDFGATIGDSGELTFASLTGDSSLPLQIWNWSGTIGTGGGTDRFIISNGPAPSNVSFFNGPGTGLYSGATVFTASNELVPVPEASTLLGVLGLMAPLAWRERRHWMRCREARR